MFIKKSASANEIVVRGMRLGEYGEVVRLIHDSVHTLCKKEYTEDELNAWVPPDMSLPNFRNSLKRCYAVVAVVNGRVAGFMSTERTGYVNRLYTSPDFVNRGVATALLESTEKWARRVGISALTLEASKSAEGFYEKRGFKKIGVVSNIKNDVRFTSASMRKELGKW